MKSKSKIVIVVGTPGSGKDILIQAVNDMGSFHAVIVPKHTSRKRESDDGNEMICCDDKDYDLKNCDIIYDNYGTKYGVKSKKLWEGVKNETIQVVVISNIKAINQIISIFQKNVIVVFVHSDMNKEEYRKEQLALGKSEEYINSRFGKFEKAYGIYRENFNLFNHVLIFSNSPEDLFDQLFRLFNYYQN